ncbi:hypothetical protein GJ496_008018 [Pomphorhynchus laevis]|nr:hypothetical protein GJ496_008018 [Pomphorhynchus laevis]
MSRERASLLLQRQLKELMKNPVDGFSAGLVSDENVFEWDVLIMGPPDTPYEGGYFKARLYFSPEYPLKPPKMRFITDIWHPNIGLDGIVCISILHEPGEDRYGYEQACERWSPVHTVETILVSVISLLSDPNDQSPANLEAADVQGGISDKYPFMWKDNVHIVSKPAHARHNTSSFTC